MQQNNNKQKREGERDRAIVIAHDIEIVKSNCAYAHTPQVKIIGSSLGFEDYTCFF
jgi:erythromycin esterase-like protein